MYLSPSQLFLLLLLQSLYSISHFGIKFLKMDTTNWEDRRRQMIEEDEEDDR